MATSLVGTILDIGRAWEAKGAVAGVGFKVVDFQIGTEGHDPSDPSIALAVDTTLTALPGQVFEDTIDSSGFLNPTCPQWTCVIETGELIGQDISSIMLVAEVLSVGTATDVNVGDRIPYLMANYPREPKSSGKKLTFTIGL